jgi:hypothetical protein
MERGSAYTKIRTLPPQSDFSGVPNWGRSVPKMTAVKTAFGYALSKSRNVGCEWELAAEPTPLRQSPLPGSGVRRPGRGDRFRSGQNIGPVHMPFSICP